MIRRTGSSTRFFFNDTATTEIYTLSLHDALPICLHAEVLDALEAGGAAVGVGVHDHLRAAAQHRVAHRVHVPDDHVRLVAGLLERVGPAVDPDEHRAVVDRKSVV